MIWDGESELCSQEQFCWGRRIVVLQSNLSTCKDCWRRGDKRFNEAFVKLLEKHAARNREREQRNEDHSAAPGAVDGGEEYKGGEGGCEEAEGSTKMNLEKDAAQEQETINAETDADGVADEQCPSPNPASRPETPVIKLTLDPDYTPAHMLSVESNGDLSRACDAVDLSDIWRNYRAPRERMDWYLLEGELLSLFIVAVWFNC